MSNFQALSRAYLSKYPGGEVRFTESMALHTTFRVGGPAELMFFPKTGEEVRDILSLCRANGVESLVIGRGSNLLVSDEGLRMAVISTTALTELSVSGNSITAGAGVMLSRLAAAALNEGLTGLEFAHGIPGSLGGAVYMNAGAYGGEMKDVVTSVTALDKDLDMVTFSGQECDFSYRHSRFEEGEYTILSAEVTLTPGDKDAIQGRMRELSAKRREKQPLDLPSAGSTFKRPENGYAAAMIEEAGLKGFSVGGAQVSPKHSGFVVNTGGATFKDVIALMEHVEKTVYERTGVMLSPEVRIIR